MLCLSLPVPFTIDALLSVCWCEYNSNTVRNCLSECAELETFFCILSIGDVLYFLMALKKYVYHCFISVTNTTEDKLVFFNLLMCSNSSSVPWTAHVWTQTIKCIDKPETVEPDMSQTVFECDCLVFFLSAWSTRWDWFKPNFPASLDWNH